jgi:hypothetical protein
MGSSGEGFGLTSVEESTLQVTCSPVLRIIYAKEHNIA